MRCRIMTPLLAGSSGLPSSACNRWNVHHVPNENSWIHVACGKVVWRCEILVDCACVAECNGLLSVAADCT